MRSSLWLVLWVTNVMFHSLIILSNFQSVQFSSVAQLCLTLCDPMNWSTPSLPVHHKLPELATLGLFKSNLNLIL